jgi:hypothetical protein
MPLVHIVINIILILAFGGLGILVSSREKKYILYLLVAFIIFLGTKAYVLERRPDLFTEFFPYTWVIFYSNLYPFAVALFIPIAFNLGESPFHKLRIAILSLGLFILSLVPYRYFFSESATSNKNIIDQNGVCIQSSNDTCSAAAAVTLLRHYGIVTTEANVVVLALTREGKGTDRLGLFRALKILTRENPELHVSIEKIGAEELVEKNIPALITVGVPKIPTTPGEREMVEKYQWEAGMIHDVVFLGRDEKDPSRVRIGEPQFGLEKWSIAHLKILFKQMAIYLED